MSFTTHPEFQAIRPFIRVIPTGKDGSVTHPRNRIELDPKAPPDIRKLALSVTMPCVHCGKKIHPFRKRAAKNERASVPSIYFAACCPIDVRIGCSRGKAASSEYARIEGCCS